MTYRAMCGHLNDYTPEFFDRHQEGSFRSAEQIVPLVVNLLRPRSVVDVGCGVGTWLKAFENAGVTDYFGLDGAEVPPDRLLIDSARFSQLDLNRPIELARQFDLSVCLEVAEHLAYSSGRSLVKTLTAAAPCTLFSAAAPGQGGTHHINEQWPDYWRKLFADFGFKRLDPIRPVVWRNPHVEWWYKQNIYLYCSIDRIRNDPVLENELSIAESCPFELIHESILGQFTTFRGITQSLLAAGYRCARRILGRGL